VCVPLPHYTPLFRFVPPRRCSLVEFATREDMKKAMDKMDGKELQGRKIKLTEEKATKRRSRSRSKDRKKEHRFVFIHQL
jgi:RNA recognition motif-containing protein